MEEELFLLSQQVSKAQMEEIQSRQAAEALQAPDSEVAALRYRIYQMEQERLLEKRMELQFNMMQSVLLQGFRNIPEPSYITPGFLNPTTNCCCGYAPNANIYPQPKEDFSEVKREEAASTETINIEPVKKKSFAEKVAEKLDGLDALKDRIADFVWDNIL